MTQGKASIVIEAFRMATALVAAAVLAAMAQLAILDFAGQSTPPETVSRVEAMTGVGEK